MKPTLRVVILGAMLLALAGCGSDEPEETPDRSQGRRQSRSGGRARRQRAAEAARSTIEITPRQTVVLRKLLKDEDQGVRFEAAAALAGCQPDLLAQVDNADDKIAAALAKALEDEDAAVRIGAARTLAGMGPRATPAVTALTAALKDKSPAVAKAARTALKEIRKPPKRAGADKPRSAGG